MPEVKGRVTATDGKPLAGAIIRIVEVSPTTREWTVRADQKGNFRQKESLGWTFVMPVAMLGPKFELTAKHGEQSSEPIPFGDGRYYLHTFGFGNPAPKFDLGDVRVK